MGSDSESDGDDIDDIPVESRLSKVILDRNIQVVILLVLFMLFSLPFCSETFYS